MILNIFGRLFRKKTIDDTFLRHSEFTRRLGSSTLLTIACIISIPFGVFIILPYTVNTVAGPSTLISLLIAFTILLIAGLHIGELSCAMPRSSLIYNWTYSSFGELPAFIIGWTSLLDYTIAITIVIRSWSDHVDLLFDGSINRHLQFVHNLTTNIFIVDSIIDERIDALSLIAVCIATILLSGSLRIVSTISVILLITSTLIILSSVMVAFFYADSIHWLNAGFFTNGLIGILHGASYVLYGYIGIDVITYLLDETQHPRRRIVSILQCSNGVLSIVFFLLTMVITLAIDVSQIGSSYILLLPQIYGLIHVPTARYMLSVGAVSGLSGAALAIFLPSTRLLCSMANDRLLPMQFAFISHKKSVPHRSLMCIFVFSSIFICIRRNVIFDIISINFPIRLLITIIITYLQHYTPEPTGLARETAHYRHFKSNNRRGLFGSYATIDDGIGSATNEHVRTEIFDDDYDSDDANETVVSSEIINQYDEHYRRQNHSNERSSLLLAPTSSKHDGSIVESDKETNQYDSIINSNTSNHRHLNKVSTIDNSLQSISLDDDQQSSSTIIFTNKHHNCIDSPCSVNDDDVDSIYRPSNHHRYEREIPELLYYDEYTGGNNRSSTPVCQLTTYMIARQLMIVFVAIACVTGIIIRCESYINVYASGIAIGILVSGAIVCICIACTNKTNEYIQSRKHKAPGSPYLSFIVIFLLLLIIISSIQLITCTKLVIWIAIGVIIYFLYGYRNSRERHCQLHDDTTMTTTAIILTNPITDECRLMLNSSSTLTNICNETYTLQH